jgi:hypothetical protein
MRSKLVLVLWAMSVMLIGGCQFSNTLRNAIITPTPIQPTLTPEAARETVQTELAATLTAGTQGADNQPCSFVWDSRPMPVETDLIIAAYSRAGIPQVAAVVQAYGESCIDPSTNEIVRFTQMQTDIYLTLTVDSMEDTDLLGLQLARVLDVLLALPRDTFVGPMQGNVQVRFASQDEDMYLSFGYDEAQQARSDELTGSVLLETLSDR